MTEKCSYYFVVVSMVAAVSGCASAGPFVVPTDSQYLQVALKKEKIIKKEVVPFAVTTETTNGHLELSTAPFLGRIIAKRFVLMPSTMMSGVIHALVEVSASSKSSFVLKLKLLKYNYIFSEYGFGTDQPVVWLTVGATLSDHGRVVSESSYISRAQCGPPFSAWSFSWDYKEAYAGYAIATYQALIVAIEQAINQRSKPIDQLRDPHCITYTKNDTWDLNGNERK